MAPNRLSRSDWLDAALKGLAEDGHETLRAERLAKRLNVSRGSFYWHFPDVGAFERAVLDRWELIAVDLPYARAGGASAADPRTALRSLIVDVFDAPVGLERAVRGWATSTAIAAETVGRIDGRRLSLLEDMFERTGAPSAEAHADAVILYCTYLGHVASSRSLMDGTIVRELVERFCPLRPTG